ARDDNGATDVAPLLGPGRADGGELGELDPEDVVERVGARGLPRRVAEDELGRGDREELPRDVAGARRQRKRLARRDVPAEEALLEGNRRPERAVGEDPVAVDAEIPHAAPHTKRRAVVDDDAARLR